MTTTTDLPLTVLPVREPLETPQVKRRPRSVERTDVLSLLGSLGAAVATTSALALLTPLSSIAGVVVVGYLFFLGYYAVLVSFDESKETVRDRIAAAVIHTACLVLLSVLVLVVAYTLVRGFPALVHWNFYTQDRTEVRPSSTLATGGIRHAIIGTLQQIGIALAITIPLGILCAVYLNEFPGRAARTVRTIVEAMTALPSIVAGLFIYATWIIGFDSLPVWLSWAKPALGGHDKSGFAAALAISVMMLPIIIRAADVVLRLVPGHLKEASYALGTSHWRTVWHVVLPTARSGLTTAVILGTARGVGETSPVLLTAGFNSVTNSNPLKGPQVSLPLQAFSDVKAPSDVMITRGFGTAAFLMLLVLLLFVVARVIGGRAPGQLSNRQRRKIAHQSARDSQRMAGRMATRVGVVAVGIALAGAFLVHPTERAYAAESYVPISGAGSTWSQNALTDWASGVVKYGMRVNYQGTGSSDGRNQFRQGTVDFGVSEIPYGLTDGGVTDTPPTGEVLLEGRDLYDRSRKLTEARAQVGMVFQKPNPFPAMSIYENVVSGLKMTGARIGQAEKDALVEEVLTKAGLWHEVKGRLREPGGALSGGQQQRLCIARSLAVRPQVLLMDEPCSALDPTSTNRIEETIRELRDDVTIVIVTHNMQQAQRVSDQCAFFLASAGTPGRIIEAGPTEQVFRWPSEQRTADYVNGRFG